MKISDLDIRKTGRGASLSLAILCGLLVTSCDNAIYDDEGDCTAHYRVAFRYDRNMKWADAFPHEVEAVTLHLLDEDGNVVWQRSEDGEPLMYEGYTMDVDVAPGRYSLLAWAGDENQHSFEIGTTGRSGNAELTARLIREREESGEAISKEQLSRLYHGYVADVEFPESEGEHRVTVPLTKNTNYVKVILQQVAGLPLDMKDIEVTITDDNGMMEWDNSLRQDEMITYRPWAVTPIAATISPEDRNGTKDGIGTSSTYTGVLAEFTTSRLVEEHKDKDRLTVRNLATGNTIFSVKLIDFLLMVKGEYNREMGNQEYLDRQDSFSLVFFLDEGHRWVNTTIFINSWKVVLQDVGFGSETKSGK
mgnify:CR=1 FL=1